MKPEKSILKNFLIIQIIIIILNHLLLSYIYGSLYYPKDWREGEILILIPLTFVNVFLNILK